MAYLKFPDAVKVLMVKSAGGLNELGKQVELARGITSAGKSTTITEEAYIYDT